MRIYYTDSFVLPLPAGHRFPMDKYARLRERIERSDRGAAADLRLPRPATDEELRRAHDGAWVDRVRGGDLDAREQRRIGFPWSSGMVERSLRSAGATIEAGRAALDEGVAVSLAGGTHHAFRERGEGFCVFNDSVVALRALQAAGRIRRGVVIDCDVHQGNGTASICARDETIFTFSIHGANNFPYRKERGDLDIALPDGTQDTEYLDRLDDGLAPALDAARADLAIYVSGADPWLGDRWGRLALTKAGLAERDRVVLQACRRRGLPLAITMAGGYAPDVDDIVDIHFATVDTARSVAR